MSTEEMDLEGVEDAEQSSRRGFLAQTGLAAAGLGLLAAPGSALAASRARDATARTRVAVVTHGDTGSFWSVFKRGVDQATKDLRERGVTVTQVYANNDVSRHVAGLNAAIAARANVIVTSVPNADALKDPLSKAASRGIEIITVNSGAGAFADLRTFDCHVGQDEVVAGEGAGKQFALAGAKEVVVVIHEAANSGLTQRAAGVKRTFKGTTKTLLIPNAKADLPGTRTKIQAYFRANRRTDGLLGLDPDVTVPAMAVAPSGTKVGTFDLSGSVISAIKAGRMRFAIDQQQYLQGYLPIVFAVLFVTNLNTVGGGGQVLTGPGIVNKANAARVEALAKAGTR
jgi:simple sugar transport system substrate-binding protein